MDALEAVAAVGVQEADKLGIKPAEGVGSGAEGPQPLQMMAPEGVTRSGSVSFREKVWTSLDNISSQMAEVHNSLKTSIENPPPIPEPTGDMLLDMRNNMVQIQGQQGHLLSLQMKLNESSSVFSLGVGMTQSVQHSARTLLQDK